jgi:hypothetical protein
MLLSGKVDQAMLMPVELKRERRLGHPTRDLYNHPTASKGHPLLHDAINATSHPATLTMLEIISREFEVRRDG